MDIQPTTCGMMVIDGDVYIDDSQNITISCKSIWIRAGSLNAGNGTAPFEHQLIIQLEGPQTDHGYVIDEALEGSKMLVVTGILALYGTAPATVFTPLQATAFAGDSNLIVGACNGWAIGDELVIAPSFSSNLEY